MDAWKGAIDSCRRTTLVFNESLPTLIRVNGGRGTVVCQP